MIVAIGTAVTNTTHRYCSDTQRRPTITSYRKHDQMCVIYTTLIISSDGGEW